MALQHDEDTAFEALQALFEKVEGSPEEKRHCLLAMGSAADPKRHAAMLDYVMVSGKVRLQDIAFPLVSLSTSSDEAARATWDYFRHNFTALQAKYESGPMWASIVDLSCRGLSTAAEVEEFFETHGGAGSATRRLSQALEIIRTRATRRDRDREALRVSLDTCAAEAFFISLLA